MSTPASCSILSRSRGSLHAGGGPQVCSEQWLWGVTSVGVRRPIHLTLAEMKRRKI